MIPTRGPTSWRLQGVGIHDEEKVQLEGFSQTMNLKHSVPGPCHDRMVDKDSGQIPIEHNTKNVSRLPYQWLPSRSRTVFRYYDEAPA